MTEMGFKLMIANAMLHDVFLDKVTLFESFFVLVVHDLVPKCECQKRNRRDNACGEFLSPDFELCLALGANIYLFKQNTGFIGLPVLPIYGIHM